MSQWDEEESAAAEEEAQRPGDLTLYVAACKGCQRYQVLGLDRELETPLYCPRCDSWLVLPLSLAGGIAGEIKTRVGDRVQLSYWLDDDGQPMPGTVPIDEDELDKATHEELRPADFIIMGFLLGAGFVVLLMEVFL